MSPEPLRSIVPMFGGATAYVETLDAILEYIDAQQPTPDELVGWHRGTFERVSSRESIERRIDYLEDVGFIARDDAEWILGPEGKRYVADQSTETLVEIMCRRNMGLRSLLYELAVAPMSIKQISHQQLETHPELGWDPSNTDMALQRTNWLRSLGLVRKESDQYALTSEGHQFIEDAVESWDDSTPSTTASSESDSFTAGTYETRGENRAIDPEFRATALSRFDQTCPVSGVDHPALLDTAHILPWAEYPDYRSDLQNVLPLSKTHHAAFDRNFFTIDEEHCLRVNPDFETESQLLRETIFDKAGKEIEMPENAVALEYLRKHNAPIEWV